MRGTRTGARPDWGAFARLLIAVILLFLLPPPVAGQEVTLTLDEALRIAKERFPALLASRNEVAAARARVRSQGAFPNPALELKREFGTADKEEGVELTQGVEIFGQWLLRRERATWELTGKESLLQRDLAELALQVKIAYFEALAAEAVSGVSRENLAVADGLLKAAKRRFELGDAPRSEWIKAEVEYTRALQEVLRTRRELAEKWATLNFFLGRDLGTPLRLQEPSVPGLEGEVARLKQLASILRPEVKEAEAALKAAESRVSLAKARWFPMLSVSLEWVRERESGARWEYRVTPKLSFPIFDFGLIRGEIEQARAEVEAARSRVDHARQQVALEVEAASLKVQEAEKQLESFQTGILRQAEDLLRLTLKGYERGALTLLDVLEAQRSFRTTKTDYAVALRAQRAARARLERAVGVTP